MSERARKLRVNLIKKLRRNLGMSVPTLAKKVGVHEGSVRRWLAGGEVFLDNIDAYMFTVTTQFPDSAA